jgi:hypothetical protein
MGPAGEIDDDAAGGLRPEHANAEVAALRFGEARGVFEIPVVERVTGAQFAGRFHYVP